MTRRESSLLTWRFD